MEDRSQSMTLPPGRASQSSDAYFYLFKSRPMRLTASRAFWNVGVRLSPRKAHDQEMRSKAAYLPS